MKKVLCCLIFSACASRSDGAHEQNAMFEPEDGVIAEGAGASSDKPGEMLHAHNALRERHCSPPLRWSKKLAKVAQNWADKLAKRDCALEHSENNKYGENLAAMTSGMMGPTGVVTMWYREIAKYDFAAPRFSMDTGHFTQVVWRSTQRVGCARAECGSAEVWVCEYSPPGNVEGKFDEEVPRLCR